MESVATAPIDGAAALEHARRMVRVNTVGNVPMHWYEDYPHIGYDIEGKKIMKPAVGNELDRFLNKMDDPAFWRTVHDPTEGRDFVMTDAEMDIIRRLQSAQYADPAVDPYSDTVEWFTSEKRLQPINCGAPEPKRRFVESKWESQKIRKIARATRLGLIVPRKPASDEDNADTADSERTDERTRFRDLWDDHDGDGKKRQRHPLALPAPKLPPPGHGNSYNPPEEYRPDNKAKNSVLSRISAMRHVPAYVNAIRDRFRRCLDLYLFPRKQRKVFRDLDADTLLPKLPDPREFEPFPKALAVEFSGHSAPVRSLSLDPTGQFLLSGSDDGTARLWDADTGRCLHVWRFSTRALAVSVEDATKSANNPQKKMNSKKGADSKSMPTSNSESKTLSKNSDDDTDVNDDDDDDDGNDKDAEEEGSPEEYTVSCVAFNPNRGISVAAVVVGNEVYIINYGVPGVASGVASRAEVTVHTAGLLLDNQVVGATKWRKPANEYISAGAAWVLRTGRAAVSTLRWHPKGDFFVTVAPRGGIGAVMVHQLSKRSSQQPLGRSRGITADAVFHPREPQLLIATQRHVRVYNLQTRSTVAKCSPGAQWISSLSVHPEGGHALIGTYDRRVCWWDIEMGATPHMVLRYHKQAVRDVAFHPLYPLFGSCSDDGTVQLLHGKLPSESSLDLQAAAKVAAEKGESIATGPKIVPVKIIRAHEPTSARGVLGMQWHHTQPWLYTCGADGKIRLWV